MSVLIGVDIGGTKTAVILGRVSDDRSELRILGRRAFPTYEDPMPGTQSRDAKRAVQQTLDRIVASADELAAQHGVRAETAALGISCGGPLDSARGIILSPPNLPGWDGVPVVQILRERIGIRTSLQNDANACALAEWMYGAGRGCQSMVFLTFGTGMGAGLILGGRLYEGPQGMAGEVGHIRLAPDGPEGYGKRGSFEGFCSGGGIARWAREVARERLNEGQPPGFCPSLAEVERITARAVFDAARSGDPVAGEIIGTCARRLGEGLAMLIDLLNPQRIVIGGIFPRAQDLLLSTVQSVIASEALEISRSNCSVVPAGLGEEIGDYAALSVAAYGLRPD